MGSEIKWHELIDVYSAKISSLRPKEQVMMSELASENGPWSRLS